MKDVFQRRGFTEITDALTGTYQPWEYCGQYRETDFNLISRLMEHEGIYYYFEHGDGSHKLVLCDSRKSHGNYPGYASIDYIPRGACVDNLRRISQFLVKQELQPGKYSLTDYDFRSPSKNLAGSANPPTPQSHAHSGIEVYDYPGEYDQTADAKSYTTIRIEEFAARFETAQGLADARGVSTGSTFSMNQFPQEERNIEYLVTGAMHHIACDDYNSTSNGSPTGEGAVYNCVFSALDAKTVFRPARTTPKPIVQGRVCSSCCG